MKTSFENLDLNTYLESNRARAEHEEKLKGLKFTNQRQEIIQSFVDKINRDRQGSKYPPVSWSQINGQLRAYAETDLLAMFKSCEEAKCFSSLFWWKLKNK